MSARVAIVGAGPAGLAAAERLSARGVSVTLFDRMASPGRKFLMAGRGGLNLTHSEALDRFMTRYGPASEWLAPMVAGSGPDDLRDWAHSLGQETFIGTSGRVFPKSMKASPLLRAWLARLEGYGVSIRTRHIWTGFDGSDTLVFDHAGEAVRFRCDAAVLALGGASWPRLGSDGSWAGVLSDAGVSVTPLSPSNAGVSIGWTDHVVDRFAGRPLKRIAASVGAARVRGEASITVAGLEGGAIYALSPVIRQELAAHGAAILVLDLRPDLTCEELQERLAAVPAKQSMASRLAKGARLAPEAVAVIRDSVGGKLPREPGALAALIKRATLTVTGLAGFERAISTAGGVARAAVDDNLMLLARPGMFVAGEMLDWDAPTGGYLLQATFATAHRAAEGVVSWLDARERDQGAG